MTTVKVERKVALVVFVCVVAYPNGFAREREREREEACSLLPLPRSFMDHVHFSLFFDFFDFYSH